jgi:hypothetical protein
MKKLDMLWAIKYLFLAALFFFYPEAGVIQKFAAIIMVLLFVHSMWEYFYKKS